MALQLRVLVLQNDHVLATGSCHNYVTNIAQTNNSVVPYASTNLHAGVRSSTIIPAPGWGRSVRGHLMTYRRFRLV